MKNKLLHHLSANTLQLVVYQAAGVVVFYVLSAGLDKAGFGQFNFALAILLVAFNLLAMGIDQVAVRKVASGDDPAALLSVYLFHVLVTGLGFYVLMAGTGFFFRENSTYGLLMTLGAGKLFMYFATPFKQVMSGLERFKVLALTLTIANMTRAVGLIMMFLLNIISLQNTALLFVAGDLAEFAFCAVLFSLKTRIPVKISANLPAYRALVRESLPQTGVTILTSAIARFDWIFIGLMLSSVKLAEYSFAYKVFEISTLPLLAVAPLLVPRFTRMFGQEKVHVTGLQKLVRAELAVATLTVVVLNAAWVPVVGWLSGGKYSTVNVDTIFILSLCIPFLYLNNFFWTIYFAEGRMQMILRGFIITFCVNAGLDLVLVPWLGNEGAAAGFLVSCAAQTIFYMTQNKLTDLRSIRYELLICLFLAIGGTFFAKKLFPDFVAPGQATFTLLSPY